MSNGQHNESAALGDLLDTMMAQFRIDALECGVSGGLADPEVAGKWLEVFDLCDERFAARLRKLLASLTPAVFIAEILRELARSDPRQLNLAVGGLDENA